jgi:hypothetical protein
MKLEVKVKKESLVGSVITDEFNREWGAKRDAPFGETLVSTRKNDTVIEGFMKDGRIKILSRSEIQDYLNMLA